jgi:hypothetical protein
MVLPKRGASQSGNGPSIKPAYEARDLENTRSLKDNLALERVLGQVTSLVFAYQRHLPAHRRQRADVLPFQSQRTCCRIDSPGTPECVVAWRLRCCVSAE